MGRLLPCTYHRVHAYFIPVASASAVCVCHRHHSPRIDAHQNALEIQAFGEGRRYRVIRTLEDPL
jgi:hypothetical protein